MMLFVESGQELLLVCSMKQGDMVPTIICLKTLDLISRCLHLPKYSPFWKSTLIWHQCLLRVEYDRKVLINLSPNVKSAPNTLNNMDGGDGVSSIGSPGAARKLMASTKVSCL
uniref:Uncharacterized protein n=1 Tax=Arundo donax TaxID=35708 RepID=A0A0A9D6G3_ARUDO